MDIYVMILLNMKAEKMKNDKLTKLVVEYKKKKDINLLTEIFMLLDKIIKEKAKYVFFVQTFKINRNEFRLVDTKKIELDDVMQELNLEIIEWINKWKPIAPFSHYLNQCLQGNKWKPRFINADFIKNLNTQSIYKENDEGDEENLADNIPTQEPIKIEFINPLTEKEQEVWELLQGNLNLSQEEIAKELDISQQTVSNIISSIKRKIQK